MRKFITIVLFIISITLILVTRFENAELTETQLLIEFWPRWVSVVMMLAVATFTGGITK